MHMQFPRQVEHSDWPAKVSLAKIQGSGGSPGVPEVAPPSSLTQELVRTMPIHGDQAVAPSQPLSADEVHSIDLLLEDEESAWWVHRPAHVGTQLGSIRWEVCSPAKTPHVRLSLRTSRPGLDASRTRHAAELLAAAAEAELAETIMSLREVSNCTASDDASASVQSAFSWLAKRRPNTAARPCTAVVSN